MAKGKHATALFEVIHSARRPPLNSPAVKMPPPRSWWKGRGKRIDSIEDLRGVGPAVEPARFAPPTLVPPPAAAEPSPRRSIAVAPPEPQYHPAQNLEPEYHEPQESEPQYGQSQDDPSEYHKPAYEPAFEPQYIDHIESNPIEPMPEPPAARSAERAVQVNSGDGAFSFRLSYGGAAAAGFILLLLIAIAFLVGTRTSDNAPADDQAVASNTATTETPGNASGMLAAVTPVATPQTAAPADPTTATPPPPAAPSANTAAAPQPITRRPGLNYVIVQSYPSLETAQRAADFLDQNGIPCSVVHGLAGWTLRSWYTVVGAQPFEVNQHTALEAYAARIKRLGNVFAGHNAFNRFEPSAYTWHADSDEDAGQ